jgi:hypothetical protein
MQNAGSCSNPWLQNLILHAERAPVERRAAVEASLAPA